MVMRHLKENVAPPPHGRYDDEVGAELVSQVPEDGFEKRACRTASGRRTARRS
ncbi:hypothetical protein [Streptosporangium sandarakinum]